MEITKETEVKIEELQILEKNLQNFLIQKQSFQSEQNETNNALEELKKTKEEVYKIIGNIMIKASTSHLQKELDEKNKILTLRISSIEKQEKIFEEKALKLRSEITKEVNKEAKQKK